MTLKDKLIKEEKRLTKKIDSLRRFLYSDESIMIPIVDKDLLIKQLRYMTGYELILEKRIVRAKV